MIKKWWAAWLMAGALWAHADETSLAIGWGELGYQLPAVGSYELPVLGEAIDGEVLDTHAKPQRLHDVFGQNNYVLLAFVYMSCSDVNGCPLSNAVFYNIKTQQQSNLQLARRLKLVSLSFDPQRDTPEMLDHYATNYQYAGNAGQWAFITTASNAKLDPILRGYKQDVHRELKANGQPGGNFSHALRVYLIDPQRRIRNIYSPAFLHQDVLINDVKTLIAQERPQRKRPLANQTQKVQTRPGDQKSGYEQDTYRTDSLALEWRVGERADLLANAQHPPLGLPPVPVPTDNPLTVEKIALGRQLFYDRRLSLNGTVSCAMCHIPEQGFTSNEISTAVGIEGRSVRRNSPSLYNSAYAKLLFHDGREENLEQQVWAPLLAKNEMGNASIGQVLQKLRALPEYAGRFEQAFGGRKPSMATLGMALASYQRTLVSADSPFDRWHFAGIEDAISAQAKRGFALFTGKARCVNCHSIGEQSALFTNHGLHNTGVGYLASMGAPATTREVLVAPGISLRVSQDLINQVGEPPAADVGRYEVTEDPADRWRYKTPSLRNVALTAPYMHNGSLSNLREVIDFYDRGGVANPGLDPQMQALHLSASEKDALLAFLQTLTGTNVDALTSDAFAAPVGDP